MGDGRKGRPHGPERKGETVTHGNGGQWVDGE
jgi:hypothetical protein